MYVGTNLQSVAHFYNYMIMVMNLHFILSLVAVCAAYILHCSIEVVIINGIFLAMNVMYIMINCILLK